MNSCHDQQRLRHLAAWSLFLSMAGCTAPPQAVSPIRIAFGSGLRQDRPQAVWSAVIDAEPDLFVFLGDTIDVRPATPGAIRQAHEARNADRTYRALHASCSVLAVWDDNDMGCPEGGADCRLADEARSMFLDAFDVPADSARRNRPGLYHAVTLGPPDARVQVILLDTRSFRGPLMLRDPRAPGFGRYRPWRNPNVTMLGYEQWRWLEETLNTPARVRIIASTLPVLAEDHGWEKWMNLPLERKRLLDLVGTSEAPVLFISGNRRFAELSSMKLNDGRPLYELASGGLNCASREHYGEPNRHRVGQSICGDNFGMIIVDPSADHPSISLEVRRADGQVALAHDLPRDRTTTGAGLTLTPPDATTSRQR